MTDERDPHAMSRRQLIRHSAWFGSAVVLTVVGGEVISHIAGSTPTTSQATRPTLRFAQISDAHLGFTGQANPNVTETFGEAILRKMIIEIASDDRQPPGLVRPTRTAGLPGTKH